MRAASSVSKSGLLLLNLGTPQSPSVSHVRSYLREFLMDPRVIDIPYPSRFLLVHGIIAPFRAAKSAEAYRSIWTDAGSPLLVHSRKLLADVRSQLDIPVELAMRYGAPSVADGLQALSNAGITSLTVFPLFPHYAMSSYESAVEAVTGQASHFRMDVKVVKQFYSDEGYISALVAVATPYLEKSDHLLFSFHGIPERHLTKSDQSGVCCLGSADCCDRPNGAHATCYRHQCFETVKSFVKRAGLAEGSYSVAFQSRLGRDEWLKPATDKHLEELGRRGVRRLAVICPSFTADCLETLEEIGIRGAHSFAAAGGRELMLIPCLNDHPAWVKQVVRLFTANQTSSLATA